MDSSHAIPKHGLITDRAFLFSALRAPNTVLLESSRRDDQNQQNFLFQTPVDILTAKVLKDIPVVFEKIDHYLKQGKWIAGYFGYECGYHFEKITREFDNRTSLPLLYLGVYNTPYIVPPDLMDVEIHATKIRVFNPHLSISVSTYFHGVERLKKYIANGDTYQVNYTDRYEFIFSGDDLELYLLLREKQHVPFGAFLNLDDTQILSFSPELFFRRKGRLITTKPMKGTCQRGKTLADDEVLIQWLKNDEKNRSENLMIVDLLRNDLGRICDTGSVQTKEMFSVEKYETVLQMTSTISGSLKQGTSYYDMFKSLFPCGSVTGAPKIRTMQVINEVERHQRGVYCGAIGFISPHDEAVFSVAIRTIVLNNSRGILGIGSGIVHDSDAAKEYEECAIKAAFLLNDLDRFELLETMLWKKEFTFLEQHLERLQQSAHYFFFSCDMKKIRTSLKVAERAFQKDKEYRVRLLLTKTGIPVLDTFEYLPAQNKKIIKIAQERTYSNDKFLLHKTTNRRLYNSYQEKVQAEEIADYIFMNERDEITEGTISNIFIETNGFLFTPPLSCGILPGIFRNDILAHHQNASEKILKLNDLKTAENLYICNSVRGWQHVTLSLD